MKNNDYATAFRNFPEDTLTGFILKYLIKQEIESIYCREREKPEHKDIWLMDSRKAVEEALSKITVEITEEIIAKIKAEEYKKIMESKHKLEEDIIKEARETITNQIEISGADSITRPYYNAVNSFLVALEIDSNVFKNGKAFEMTEAFKELCGFILDEKEDITAKIRNRRFKEISPHVWFRICDMVYQAIFCSNAFNEIKDTSYTNFTNFIKKNRIILLQSSASFRRNDVVDEILNIVWQEVLLQEWKPNQKHQHAYQDDAWTGIVEAVYDSLLDNELLEYCETDEGSFSQQLGLKKCKLSYDCEIPITHYFKLPNNKTE